MRTGLVQQDVRDDFDRARRRAARAKMAGWLLGRPARRNRLAVLGEVTSAPGAGGPGRRLEYERVGGLRPADEAMVPISQIVGTVEPARCFDRQFPPTSGPAAGWTPSSSTYAAAPTTCSTGITASPWLGRLVSARSARLSPRFG